MKINKSNLVTLIVIAVLAAYATWLLWLDRLRPTIVMVALLAAAFALPVVIRYLIARRALSILASILLTPCILTAIVFFASSGEDTDWLPLIAAWAIVVTSPIFIGVSIVVSINVKRRAEQTAGANAATLRSST
jgi:hypothetical protein